MSFIDYTISGLRLRSEIKLPELVEASETATQVDVRLLRAETPEALDNPVNRGVLYQAAPAQFLLQMPNIARYWVRTGDEILVTPAPQAQEAEIRLFLLGTVWAALLHQRGLLVLHASGIATPEGAVIFMGRSSAGKSSLAAAFYQRGYPVLGDDVIALNICNGRVLAFPGFPQLRLWPDMLSALEIATDSTLALRPKLAKRVLPVPDGFDIQPLPVRAIYLLHSHIQDEIRLEKFEGMSRFTTLLNHTFREKFLGGLGVRPIHFQKVSQVAQKTYVASLVRPDQPPNFEQLFATIKQDLAI